MIALELTVNGYQFAVVPLTTQTTQIKYELAIAYTIIKYTVCSIYYFEFVTILHTATFSLNLAAQFATFH